MHRRRVPARRILAFALLIAGAWAVPQTAQGAIYNSMAAGAEHTCAIRPGGSVYCWGIGNLGQLGVIGATRARSPIGVIGSYTAQAITSGDQYWCELRPAGKVACSGQGNLGQLGTGGTSLAQFPQDVVNLPPASKVDAGRGTTCAITSDGLYCWGDGTRGQIGDGRLRFDPTPTPEKVAGAGSVTDVSVGSEHVCTVRTDKRVGCWGDTAEGRLGNDRESAITEAGPVVDGITDAKSVVAAQRHSCALRENGTVMCWGNNELGQLGAGPVASTRVPVAVQGLSGVTQISAGTSTTCAVKNDGTVWCWGDGLVGQLGNGARLRSNVPVQVQGLSEAVSVTVGTNHACATTVKLTPFCWGSNRYAQLGSGGLIGVSGVEQSAQIVQDAVRGTGNFLPTPLAERNRTDRGGVVYLRLLRLTRRGSKCPTSADVTIRARGREVVRKATDIEKVDAERACLVTGRLALPANTQRAFTVVVVVRGSKLKTRKIKLRPKLLS